MSAHREKATSVALRQKPLIMEANTRTLFDVAKERGVPFSVVFDEAVKNKQYIPIPKEFKLWHRLKTKIKTILNSAFKSVDRLK